MDNKKYINLVVLKTQICYLVMEEEENQKLWGDRNFSLYKAVERQGIHQ